MPVANKPHAPARQGWPDVGAAVRGARQSLQQAGKGFQAAAHKAHQAAEGASRAVQHAVQHPAAAKKDLERQLNDGVRLAGHRIGTAAHQARAALRDATDIQKHKREWQMVAGGVRIVRDVAIGAASTAGTAVAGPAGGVAAGALTAAVTRGAVNVAGAALGNRAAADKAIGSWGDDAISVAAGATGMTAAKWAGAIARPVLSKVAAAGAGAAVGSTASAGSAFLNGERDLGKLAQAAGVGAIGGAIPGGAGASLRNKVAGLAVGAATDGGVNAALTAGSAIVGGERDTGKIVRDSLEAGATGAASHVLGSAAHSGLQRTALAPRPGGPELRSAPSATEGAQERNTIVPGPNSLQAKAAGTRPETRQRTRMSEGPGNNEPVEGGQRKQRASASANGPSTENAGGVPPGGGNNRKPPVGGTPDKPGENNPSNNRGNTGNTPPGTPGTPRIVQRNPDGTFQIYRPDGAPLQPPAATPGPPFIGAVPPQELPSQVPPFTGLQHPIPFLGATVPLETSAPAPGSAFPVPRQPANPDAPALPRTASGGVDFSQIQPKGVEARSGVQKDQKAIDAGLERITSQQANPPLIQTMDDVAKRFDLRVQGTASLPLGPVAKPLAGSLMIGPRTLTHMWKNGAVFRDAAMTVLTGGKLSAFDRDMVARTAAGAVGINAPSQGIRGSMRDATLGGEAKLPVGMTDTMRFRVPTLQASALAAFTGGAPGGIGVNVHAAEYSYQRATLPQPGPDPVVGYVTAKAPLRVNAEPAALPFGQRDAFGSASREHYRLTADLKIDDLTKAISTPFGSIEKEYGTSGADVVIPAGSYVPKEFVDNLRTRLDGATAEMTVPVRRSERERFMSLADQFSHGARQPGRAPDAKTIKVDGPSIRRFSPTGAEYGEQSKRLHVNFSATEHVLFMPLQATNAAMRMLSGGRLGLPDTIVQPKTIPGTFSPADALVSPRDFRRQAETLVSTGIGTSFKLGNLATFLPEGVRGMVSRVLPTAGLQVQISAGGGTGETFAPRSVRREETSTVGIGYNGRLVSNDPRALQRARPQGPSMDVPSWTVRPLTSEVSQVPVGGKKQLETWLAGLRLPPGSPKAEAVRQFTEATLPQLKDTGAVSAPQRDALRTLIQTLLQPDAPPSLPPGRPVP